MTLLAWCAFLYLLIRGIMAVGSNQMQGVDMPFFSAAFAAPQPTSSVSAKASPQASMQ